MIAQRHDLGARSERSRRNAVNVYVGEWQVAAHPQVLVTQALGSCVGVCLWDEQLRIGSMAHVMLPVLPDGKDLAGAQRFASHAVPQMVERLRRLGAPASRLQAKIAGGAAMFRCSPAGAAIGDRNVEEARKQLALLKIPLVAEDTGGSHARTLELHLDTGILLVRSYRYGLREL